MKRSCTVNESAAAVFSQFETGLGVARSLGRKGIKVLCVDFKKDIAWYSRYVTPLICPHPLKEMPAFLDWVAQHFEKGGIKYPVFICSDDFLVCFSMNRSFLSNYFLFNLVDQGLLERITDKHSQYLLAKQAGISQPETRIVTHQDDLGTIDLNDMRFPVFIKGLEVNSWREKISGTVKGFAAASLDELHRRARDILKQDVPIVIQEIIQGPDTSHFKYNVYVGLDGQIKAEFTLRKIRQNPIHFGVGAVVESIHDPDLVAQGRKLFKGIGFAGIGSAEFKRDEQDGQLKLIEINPRYWQQNYLATACGMNFPHINYCDLTGMPMTTSPEFKAGIKWVNRYMDVDSFLKYRKEGSLTFSAWRRSLKGKKTYADFTWDDPIPVLYEIGFGAKLIRAPWFFWKRICR
ncbi:carboxylate--amine ligase [Desulfotignum phosphitoxidans]|uniref:ATP-grasp domain-containing protein n=1 Tax=Desulfotignum phosphitoxidans DSM 13687 TaxID=1286635 RepID=S0FWZ7_9BACT|nr:hypothetical protein [Desulfotignum phosphitoxidans]EMS77664.1 hypothetical protein Dpo_13c00620 [Desulfotignum phosphitoxidans DSM 13687]